MIYAQITNSVLSGNSASLNGGGIFSRASYETKVRNCTFYKNNCNGKGSGFFNGSDRLPEISNSIFSDNYKFNPIATNLPGVDIEDSLSTSSVWYCLLQAYKGNTSNTSAVTAFFQQKNIPSGQDNVWGTLDDGLRITAHSAAFNTGGNNFRPNTLTDITGAPRIQNNTIDIGAYEIYPCSLLITRTAYVDSTAKGTESGASWSNAFSNLQSAINLKRAGCIDTIKVAKGTYLPDSYPNGLSGNYSSNAVTFSLPDSTLIIGGYPSGGGNADPFLNQVILKGESKNSNNITVNNTHVVVCAGVKAIKLTGLTITDGKAMLGDSVIVNNIKIPGSKGGGITALNSDLEMNKCFLFNNQAVDGGAINAYISKLNLTACSIYKNSAANSLPFNGGGGGAIFLQLINKGSSFISCNIDSNTSPLYGGGLYTLYADSLKIDSCSFTGNKTIQVGGNVIGGGAIYNYYSKGSAYTNCLFKGNSGYTGGALSDYGAYTKLVNCSFIQNVAQREGGGIYLSGNTSIYNTLFYGNYSSDAGNGGGAISTSGGKGVITNCAFIANKSNGAGGAVYSDGLTINNSLFWYNLRNNDSTIAGADFSGIGAYSRNLLQVSLKTYNITGYNPLFKNYSDPDGPDNIWGTADDGIIPSIFSPAINMGDNSAVPSELTKDILGSARIQAKKVDIGIYEADFCGLSSFSNRTAYVDSSATNGTRTGGSWLNAYLDIESAIDAFNAGCIDTIKVAQGNYTPTIVEGSTKYWSDTTSPLCTYNLPSNIIIIGGYPSGGGVANSATNKTILNGKGKRSFALFHLITLDGVNNALIDGLYLRNAANYYSANDNNVYGGGLYASQSKFVIKNCVAENNYSGSGSGFGIISCNATVNNCIFDSDTTGGYGAAVFDWNSSVQYINNVFYNNKAHELGGAVFSNNSTSTYTNCTFFKNAAIAGAGICYSGVSPKVNNCIFWGSKMYQYNDSSYLDVTPYYSQTQVLRKISYSLLQYPVPNSTNTITRNYPSFVDTINPKGADGLWRTSDDGLRLQNNSPAINKGINDSLPAGISSDIINNQRVFAGTVDMGAYEFGASQTLPVTFINFNATKQEDKINLTWQTQTEVNLSHFDIERSVDGITFSKVGSSIASNSLIGSSYNFIDAYHFTGKIYYRLKIVDKDFNFKYSSVVSILSAYSFNISLFPNPAKEDIILRISSEKQMKLQLQVTNINGMIILSKDLFVQVGVGLYSIKTSDFQKGYYILKIKPASGKDSSIKFQKL